MSTHTPQNQDLQRLPRDPARAMQEMMRIVDAMRDVYKRETSILDAQDIKGFLNIQAEKLEKADMYKTRIEELLARKVEMRKLEPSIKKRLENAQADFAELSAKNMQALKRMQRTTTRLGEKIQDVARKSANADRAFSYGMSGKLDSQERKRVSIGVQETA